MAKVMTPEQFRNCPRGTVFAFGERWHFGRLLILDEIIGPLSGGGWGFFAIDPMWVESDDSGEAIERLEAMSDTGASYPADTASTKYMSYDGETMDLFFVLEKRDVQALSAVAMGAFP